MSIYDNIDRLLEERHMSRRKLARLAGIKETTLASAFSNRPEHFPRERAEKIAEVLEVPVEELYDDHHVSALQKMIESLGTEDILQVMRSKLVESFNRLNFTGQMTLLQIASEMRGIETYTTAEDGTIVWRITRADHGTDRQGGGKNEEE